MKKNRYPILMLVFPYQAFMPDKGSRRKGKIFFSRLD
jgi:hypothetical protein